MATQPITPNELIEAAKRLRRRGMKTSIKANDYIMTEIGRLKKDVSDALNTYFSLGSRLNKGYKDQYGEDYTKNVKLQEASINLMGVLDNINDAIEIETSGKSTTIKDIENASDSASGQIKDLLNGMDDQLELVSRLASKFGNRDLIHATEMLSTDLSNTMEILKGI